MIAMKAIKIASVCFVDTQRRAEFLEMYEADVLSSDNRQELIGLIFAACQEAVIDFASTSLRYFTFFIAAIAGLQIAPLAFSSINGAIGILMAIFGLGTVFAIRPGAVKSFGSKLVERLLLTLTAPVTILTFTGLIDLALPSHSPVSFVLLGFPCLVGALSYVLSSWITSVRDLQQDRLWIASIHLLAIVGLINLIGITYGRAWSYFSWLNGPSSALANASLALVPLLVAFTWLRRGNIKTE